MEYLLEQFVEIYSSNQDVIVFIKVILFSLLNSSLLNFAENGKEGVIKRELSNHECYYTGDISGCEEALDEIIKVYRQEAPNHYDD